MKIKDVTRYLGSIAPSNYQESYDNSGLIVGHKDTEVTGIIVSLDCIESIVDEAIEKGCNLIVAHHPIVFRGLKRFNGSDYVQRTVIKAIKHDIAIFAIHTNLDNVKRGVNKRICDTIGLVNTKILSPKKVSQRVRIAFHGEDAKEAVAQIKKISSDIVLYKGAEEGDFIVEAIFPGVKRGKISGIAAEFDGKASFSEAGEATEGVGSGMIGELAVPMEEKAFLKHLKTVMKTGCVKYTNPLGKKVKKVAVCGGAGGFLLNSAISKKADVFVTSDYKYHEFFDADGKIIIADIGHFESEQFTIDLLHEILTEKFTTFAILKTGTVTNPVNYL